MHPATNSEPSSRPSLSWSDPPLCEGTPGYVNLDHAATTPALSVVKQAVDAALPYYGGVHRGRGFNSELSTELYQRCRMEVLELLGGDPLRHVVVFGRNTTDLINVLSHSIAFDPGDVVVVTGLEHHSNDLPWRRVARVARVEADAHGGLSEDAVEACFKRHRGRVKLLAVTGASNVTGYLPDIGLLADLAHRYGAKIFVDAAQLVAHRPLRLVAGERELDFVAFSGHKMYAPFGSGALVGAREAFEQRAPFASGGGTVSLVTSDRQWWLDAPHRQEAGTPNLLGAVALARACRALRTLDLRVVAERERTLTRRLLRGLSAVPGATLYGSPDPDLRRDRVGIVPFNLRGLEHAEVAEALALDHGISVRSGCFCAQPLVTRLLGRPELSELDYAALASHLRKRPDARMPGMVRVSLGLCTSGEEVDRLCQALCEIAADPRPSQGRDERRRQRRNDIARMVAGVFAP
ncbi:MAG: aminotransferase [Polyangiaceae bacterium]|jgi:selenocysteine lyase/cysteine desulfurase|nr:aminotransferase [Polyangiaceae bacterium]